MFPRPVALVLTAACLLALVSGCARSGRDAPQAATLGIPGRDNAQVTVASRGETVVLAWAASSAGLDTQVFAAVSRDAGRTFGEPRRVDDGRGVVRVSGEQPPRVAIGARAIAVLWPAREGEFNQIRVARSSDDGRTFGPSMLVHEAGLAGVRGWASLAFDGQDRLHALWLDGRNEPMKMNHAAMTKPSGDGGASPSAQPVQSPRQDLYHALVDGPGPPVETQVADHVCFCCKTAIVARADGSALVAWRHIFPNSERDIGFAALSPAGARLGDVERASADHWELDACPDDGPSMTTDGRGAIHLVWPTLVGGDRPAKGIFYTTSADGHTFAGRVRLDDGTGISSSHPHIVMNGDAGLAAVWDVPLNGSRRVVVRRASLASGQAVWAPQEILPSDVAAYYPDIAGVPDGLVVAWTSDAAPNSTIVVRRLPSSR